MIGNPLLTLRHAVENASPGPISDDELLAILRGCGGTNPQVRALFEDASLQTMVRAGATAGVGIDVILAAYAKARVTVGAVNRALDEALLGGW